MVVGGHDGTGYSANVELVSLDPVGSPVPACLRFPRKFPIPFSVYTGAKGGAVIKGKKRV